MADCAEACCKLGCLCVGGVCVCGLLVAAVIGRAGFEAALSPVSIPCSLYRRWKYNKWIKEWYAKQTVQDQNACDAYFGGITTYKSMNSLITLEKALQLALKRNQNDQDLKQAILIIPECVRGNNRYFWNCSPDKEEFFKIMDNMVPKLRVIGGHREGTSIDSHRLHELLIESTKECSICQDDGNKLTVANSTVTPCTHIYHTSCLDTWKQHNPVCPYCRKEI